jgi:hypothetical protein
LKFALYLGTPILSFKENTLKTRRKKGNIMSVPYHAFTFGYAPTETSLRETVAAVTQTFRRSTIAGKLARLAARIGALFQGSTSASEAWAARHARDVDALNRMAHDLETSQPALATELMLLASR